ncbi:MAG: ScbA/BarX family gamma-butyrolactone biosynthesis protein [Jatrophihabitantaceae bacterium]
MAQVRGGHLLIQGIRKRGKTELSWQRTVDRALVHRDAIAEVLLTDIVQLDRTSFEVAAQWSRSHRVYRPDHEGRYDPMLLLETVRQTGLALSHHGFGVPFGYKSVMHDVGFEMWPEAEPLGLHAATNVTIRVECENVVLRGDHLRGMTVVLAMSAHGMHFATGSGTLSWLPERTFQALRARNGGSSTASALPPAGGSPVASRFRAAADSLLVAEDPLPGRRRVLVPLDHPVYFDHPLDHVPGMLLADAAWQAASTLYPTSSIRLVECSMICPAFTELFIPAWVLLEPVGPGQIAFRVEQDDRTTASGKLRFTIASAVLNS